MSTTASYDVSSLFRVDGLVAVVTGGGTGIGLNLANALDVNGAKAVYVLGRREDRLLSAASSAKNGSTIPIVCDVTSQDSLKAAAERVRTEHGYVNAVLANAGVEGFMEMGLMAGNKLSAKEFVDVFWQAGIEDMASTLKMNVAGPYFTALAFLELLVAGNQKGNVSQKSQIIVTTSIAGFLKLHPGPGYVASKAAATQLCKWMGLAFAPYGVRVNGLAPGLFLTDMSASFATEGVDVTEEGALPKVCHSGAVIVRLCDTLLTQFLYLVPQELVPLARFGRDQELAGSVLFLLSKAGGYMSGDILINDGGCLNGLPSSY